MDTGGLALAALGAAISTTKECIKYVEKVRGYEKETKRLGDQVEAVKDQLEEVSQFCSKKPTREAILKKILVSADSCKDELEKIRDRFAPGNKTKIQIWKSKLTWPFKNEELDKILRELGRHKDDLHLAITLETASTTDRIAIDTDKIVLTTDKTAEHVEHIRVKLDKVKIPDLPVADGAAFNSYANASLSGCHKETRTEILQDIEHWIQDANSPGLLWLNGMAGTGKSTISMTVAKTNQDASRLGASFFFKRGEGDRGKASKFFCSLAAQLMTHLRELVPKIQEILDADPRISDKNLTEQFNKLILIPLKTALQRSSRTVVIVVDALDECEPENDAGTILDLLSRLSSVTTMKIKVFATSRPEAPISTAIKDIDVGLYRSIALQEVQSPSIEHDIQVYLRDELSKIQKKNRFVPLDWPAEHDFQALLQMSVPLFIFASTMCRFIGQTRLAPPHEQLVAVLKYRGLKDVSRFDQTYRPVLDRLLLDLTDSEKVVVIERFKSVVGLVIILAEPLSSQAIAQVLSTSPQHIYAALDELHSVLDIPSDLDLPVRLYHLSFRDFLLDNGEKDRYPFKIDRWETHDRTATQCMQLLMKTDCLKQDICNLKDPGILLSDIDQALVTRCLPPEVQYACRFWFYHLKAAAYQIVKNDIIQDHDIIQDFLEQKLLYWLEAMSLMGRAYECANIIQDLNVYIANKTVKRSACNDALRFVNYAVDIIAEAPLQLYSSSLLFAPRESHTKRIYTHLIPKWIVAEPLVEFSWSRCQKTLVGHTATVFAVVFSSNGIQLASGDGEGYVRLWNSYTGELQHVLNRTQHSGRRSAMGSKNQRYYRISFLEYHEGFLVSACMPRINLWNPINGRLVRGLEMPHGMFVEEVLLHKQYCVTRTTAAILIIHNIVTGLLLHSICMDNHTSIVTMVVCKSKLIVLTQGAGSNKVMACDLETGVMEVILHRSGIYSLQIYQDQLVLLSTCLEIWSFAQDGLRLESKISIEIESPFDLLIAGETLLTRNHWQLQFHDPPDLTSGAIINSPVSHSPDIDQCGRYLAWANVLDSNDIQIILHGYEHLCFLKGHLDHVQCIAFSPMSLDYPFLPIVASGASDCTVKLWGLDWVHHALDTSIDSGQIGLVHLCSTGAKAILGCKNSDCFLFWTKDEYLDWDRIDFEEHHHEIIAAAFTETGELAATADSSGSIVIWRTEDLQVAENVASEYGSFICSLLFTTLGNTLISGHYDGAIKFWDVSSGNLLRSIAGHNLTVFYMALSHDDSQLVTSAFDATVKLWSTTTGVNIQTETIREYDKLRIDFPIYPLHDKITSPQEGKLRQQSRGWQDFTLKGEWICYRDRRLLWLPYEYRPGPGHFDAVDNHVMIVNSKSMVLHFEFDKNILETLLKTKAD